jgi:uncharacterized integral membrane protein
MRRDDGGEPLPADTGGRSWLSGRLIIVAIIVAAVLLVVFQNTGDVTVNFLTFDFTMPIWLLLVIFLVLGVILGQIFEFFRRRRRRKARRD